MEDGFDRLKIISFCETNHAYFSKHLFNLNILNQHETFDRKFNSMYHFNKIYFLLINEWSNSNSNLINLFSIHKKRYQINQPKN